jgi:hypothetical protein
VADLAGALKLPPLLDSHIAARLFACYHCPPGASPAASAGSLRTAPIVARSYLA